jgi:mono/diheme cytochrome c family protein
MEDGLVTSKLAWGTVALLLVAGPIWAGSNNSGEATKAGNSQIEHGKYLVDNVAGCSDCHTPFTDKGLPDQSKYLQGAPLMFKPTVDMPWAAVAPPIAGLPMLSEKEGVEFLMSGKLPGSAQPRPPMPPYRMNKADAEAVVAYLKSLK